MLLSLPHIYPFPTLLLHIFHQPSLYSFFTLFDYSSAESSIDITIKYVYYSFLDT